MNNNIARKAGVLGLLMTISGAMKAEHMAAIDQKIDELAHSIYESGAQPDLSFAQI